MDYTNLRIIPLDDKNTQYLLLKIYNYIKGKTLDILLTGWGGGQDPVHANNAKKDHEAVFLQKEDDNDCCLAGSSSSQCTICPCS